jgi:hypothetical protein
MVGKDIYSYNVFCRDTFFRAFYALVQVQDLVFLRNSEKRNVHIGMLRNRMTNTLCAISYKLRRGRCTFTVDGLGVPALRVVGDLLGGGKTKDVGPLL